MLTGRPSLLDDHLFRKIKELVLDKKNLREISEILEIPYATMRDWEYENYKGFSDRMLAFKHERMLRKAETNIEELMSSEDERVKADVSKFSLETLGKKTYSKRVEQSGVDGKELPQPILYVFNNDKPQENIEDAKEDTSSTGGDISIEDNLNPVVVNSPIKDGQGEETNLDSIGVDTSLETRSDARLQEHNDSSPILEGLELERNG